MSTNFRVVTLARAAALALVLAAPVVSAAYADDEYGTNSSPKILSSAQSVNYANAADTPLARATAAAKAAAQAYAANRSTVATDAPQSGPLDLNGQGGPQDRLGNEIYQPGTGTDW
jgi:hypothetical protein